MSRRLATLAEQGRLFVLLARPAVMITGALFALLGAAHAGAPGDAAVVPALVVVLGYLVASVAWNDLADVAVDAVNLPGVASRPLVTERADRRQMVLIGVLGVVIALAGAAPIGVGALAVTVTGLVLSAAYSLPPFRLSGRGIVAPLLLPFGYVAVPYLNGVLAVGPVTRGDLLLMGGLYLGFVGRIVLKDFRDVRGDALLGKRTFLVRHGRVPTCLTSAVFWVVGSSAVLAARDLTPQVLVLWTAQVGLALWLLRELALCTARRREDALVMGLALVGRSQVVLLLAHYALLARAVPEPTSTAALTLFVTAATAVLASRLLAAPPREPAPTRTPVPHGD